MRFSKKGLCIYLGLLFVTPFVFSACADWTFPTLANVKTMAETEKDFQKDLQGATVDVMTEQHSAQTPELSEAMQIMQSQYNEVAAQLRAMAADKDAAIKGFDAGGLTTGGLQGLFNILGLGWLWPVFSMFFGKSRASEELSDLKMKLATKAGTNEELPG